MMQKQYNTPANDEKEAASAQPSLPSDMPVSGNDMMAEQAQSLTANNSAPTTRGNQAPMEIENASLAYYQGSNETAPKSGDTIVIINPTKPRWRRFKRGFRALGVIFGLALLAVLLDAILGEEAVPQMRGIVEQLWWPATLLRWTIYIVISFLILPVFMKHVRSRAMTNLEEQQRQLFLNGTPDQVALQQIETARLRIARSGVKARYVFLVLMCFDLLTLQLPYILR